MVDITYRLTGPWGPGKGSNLQPSEVDNNFWAIAQAIVDLETNPAVPVGIESITMSGSLMTIYLTDGSTMGPFPIPVLTFSWRGEWQPTTSYAELDVFSKADTGIFLVLLAHTSGSTFDPDIAVGTPPAPALQKLFGATDGTLAGLGDVEITTPVSGQLLQFNGSYWVNADLGAGPDGVISISAGSGLAASPNPIIESGTIGLAPINDKYLLANTLGSAAAPLPNTLTQYLDAAASSARGSVLVRNATLWTALAPGTAGQYLKTGGSGADAAWDSPAGSGTVISVSAGPGLTTGGSPITSSGTVSIAAITDKYLLANVSGSSAAPVGTSLSALIDSAISSTRGSILYRGGSAWVALAPGAAGQVLTAHGAGTDPSWTAAGGGSIPAGAENDQIVYVSGAWTAQRPRYVVACYVPGLMTASQNLLHHRFSKAVTIPANAGAYLGHASEAAGSVTATGLTVVTLAKAISPSPTSFSDVGTITFAAGAAVGTFATSGGAAVTFAQGDILRVRGPGTPDATLADFMMTLVGFET
jgi:hypothetical protein